MTYLPKNEDFSFLGYDSVFFWYIGAKFFEERILFLRQKLGPGGGVVGVYETSVDLRIYYTTPCYISNNRYFYIDPCESPHTIINT